MASEAEKWRWAQRRAASPTAHTEVYRDGAPPAFAEWGCMACQACRRLQQVLAVRARAVCCLVNVVLRAVVHSSSSSTWSRSSPSSTRDMVDTACRIVHIVDKSCRWCSSACITICGLCEGNAVAAPAGQRPTCRRRLCQSPSQHQPCPFPGELDRLVQRLHSACKHFAPDEACFQGLGRLCGPSLGLDRLFPAHVRRRPTRGSRMSR